MGSLTLNYCEEEKAINVSEQIQATPDDQIILYKILCPPLILACLISVTLNVGLIIVGRLGTNRKSPVLILSLNLACTDTMASLLNGVGFVFNSYLPVVFDVHFDTCPFLAMEIARSSALISSVLHLLALAFIHYKGIVRPLHYRVRTFFSHHVTRSIYLISTICWLIPLTAFTVYFYSIPCQGFRSAQCDYKFLASKGYRLFILAFFAVPLVLMFFIYVRIFLIIQRNQRMRQAANGCVNESAFPNNVILVKGVTRKNSLSSTVTIKAPASTPRHILILKNCQKCWKGNSTYIKSHNTKLGKSLASVEQSTTTVAVSSKESTINLTTSNGTEESSSSLRLSSSSMVRRPQTNGPSTNNTKALFTSLLILGTYLLCWVPAVTFLVLTCIDGCPFPLLELPRKEVVIISSICNFLVILKAIVDPFIYIFRTKEVKAALKKLFRPNQQAECRQIIRSTISRSTGGSTTPKNICRKRLNN